MSPPYASVQASSGCWPPRGSGELTERYAFVDYFPSCDLIASHPTRAALFEPDLRNVSAAGVDLVMRHFFAEHRIDTELKDMTDDTPPSPTADDDAGADPVCEELLLADWRR